MKTSNNKLTVDTVDPRMAPALFVKPLFRLRLVEPANTQLGYLLIDVIAVLPPRPLSQQGGKFPFPYYVCMALCSSGTWVETQITDGDGHCDLGEAYEVVS